MSTNKINYYHLASRLVLLAFLFGFQYSFAQKTRGIEKLYQKISSAQSGYIHLTASRNYLTREEDTLRYESEIYFYKINKHFNYVQTYKYPYTTATCNIGKTILVGDSLYSMTIPYNPASEHIDLAQYFLTAELINGLFENNEDCQVSNKTYRKI